MTMSVKKCCVPNCSRTGEILHLFPNPVKDMAMFRTWIYAVGGDILALDNDKIYKLRRICHAHFEPRYHTRSHRLAANAVPTLNLPGFSIVKFVNRKPMHDVTNKVHDVQQPPATASTSNVMVQNIVNTAASTVVEVKEKPMLDLTNKVLEAPVEQPPATATSTSVEGTARTPLYAKHSNEMHQLKHKLYKLKRAKDSLQTRLKKVMRLADNPSFKKTLTAFTAAAVVFIMMQFREGRKKKLGRRFTKNEKMMALALYKQGPKAYRWLRKIFVLPSPLTITRMISMASLRAGLNENIFKQLSKRVQKMKESQKLCVLLFDEVALKPHFDYNRRRDAVTGFVDNGEETCNKIADHALVFMIKGIFYNYKQAVTYTFCSGSTSKQELTVLIKKVIRKVQSTGFNVLGTICDQGCANVSAINSLIQETRDKYRRINKELRHNVFEVDGKEIIPIFDTPHLLKGIRNNLLTKNLKCTIKNKEKIAKWEHIVALFKEDPAYQGLRLMPKLTEKHVIAEKIPKMKVKCATQVFSQSVAVNMGYLANKGILSKESQDTADILLFFDKLFDSLNGSYENSKNRSGKPLLCAVTPKSAHKPFWTEAIKVLKTMKFVNKNGKSGIVPSITNWIFSIENMQLMVEKLFNEYGLTSLWMRHFNQDPLENFFGSIRSHGYRNVSPTCAGFESAFASLLINNISSMHSPGANCEQDSSKVFKSLSKIFFEKPAEITSRTELQIDFDYLSDNIFVNLKEKLKSPKILAQLQYVAGYALKKTKKVFKRCLTCNKDLISDENSSYIILRERIANKRLLTYPSNNLMKCFSEMQDIVSYVIVNQVRIKNIKNYMKIIFAVVINYNFITCSKHKKDVISLLEDVTCNIFLYNWCKRTNDLLDGKSTDADKNDIIQMIACEYYKKRLKRQRKFWFLFLILV